MFLQHKLRFVLPADAGEHVSLLLPSLIWHPISPSPQHYAWFPFPLIFFVHWQHFPSWLLLIFVCHFFPGFFSGFMLWPWPDLQTVMNFIFFEPGVFLHLDALAHFLFWSPWCRFPSCIFCDFNHPRLFFSFFPYSNFPSQLSFSGIFLFFLP